MIKKPRFDVMPLRFSSDPPGMIQFLRTLGLEPSRTTVGLGFGELRAGAGRVMVHRAEGSDTRAQPGETQLCLMTDSADDVLELAGAAGFDVTVWDESYGRQAAVAGPYGEWMWINEEQTDLYGYQGYDATGFDDRLVVSAIRQSPDFDADRAFFSIFGLSPLPGGNKEWEALRGTDTAGIIGLHHPAADSTVARLSDSEPLHRVPLVGLGFQTGEPLDPLCDRLVASGYDARVVVDRAATKVHVVDPDGLEIEIHPLG